MKKKSIVFIKKQKKKNLGKKEKILFKLNKELEYIKIIKILNKNKILLFFQFLSLNSINDEMLYKSFIEKKMDYIFITKKHMKKLFKKNKYYNYIKNFNNILAIPTLEKLEEIKKFFKEKKILILGYYFNKILFSKNDLKMENTDKKKIWLKIKERKIKIKKIYIKIINILKKYINKVIKILWIWKKKKCQA